MRRRNTGEGRIKRKVRSLMLEAGWNVTLWWEQQGDYRIHKYQWDVACWGCHALATDGELRPEMTSTREVLMSCWNTMGECAKRGITVTHDHREGWEINPNAKA